MQSVGGNQSIGRCELKIGLCLVTSHGNSPSPQFKVLPIVVAAHQLDGELQQWDRNRFLCSLRLPLSLATAALLVCDPRTGCHRTSAFQATLWPLPERTNTLKAEFGRAISRERERESCFLLSSAPAHNTRLSACSRFNAAHSRHIRPRSR